MRETTEIDPPSQHRDTERLRGRRRKKKRKEKERQEGRGTLALLCSIRLADVSQKLYSALPAVSIIVCSLRRGHMTLLSLEEAEYKPGISGELGELVAPLWA